MALLAEVLQHPEEGATVGRVAQRRADVADIEGIGQDGQNGDDLLVQLAGPASPGRWRGSGLAGGLRERGRRGGRVPLLSGRVAPGQLQEPELVTVGGLHPLQPQAALLLKLPLAVFELVVCHERRIASQSGFETQRRQAAADLIDRL